MASQKGIRSESSEDFLAHPVHEDENQGAAAFDFVGETPAVPSAPCGLGGSDRLEVSGIPGIPGDSVSPAGGDGVDKIQKARSI